MRILNVKFASLLIAGMGLATTSFGQVGFSGTVNSGSVATALGYRTEALGTYSSSFGDQTKASGERSTVFGFRSTASGDQSFAAGHWSTASGLYSFALGARAVASNGHAMAFGIDVQATDNRSMIIGTGTGKTSPNPMVNGIPNSLMIGFNSTVPTLFVGASSGAGTTGKVGVGTTSTPSMIGSADLSEYSLYVAGGLLAEEVRVRTGWADYVFYDNYQLKPLDEVADYIEENGHLPNVPSAEQVEEEGIELGDITRIQQEKIEELTLYLIELKQEVEALKVQLTNQENNSLK
ncbi:MAG: hypothetical protein AB8B56_18825 [Crocinitomicaceae bacterium]